jgi:hypothetical protein
MILVYFWGVVFFKGKRAGAYKGEIAFEDVPKDGDPGKRLEFDFRKGVFFVGFVVSADF